MMASIIDLSIRRIIAVGGKLGHIAGLDNFCWPDPVQSEKTPDGEYKLAQLVRANQALYDYTKAFKVPCISGKDSMKNDSTRGGRKISIPPTVLFSAISRMEDISKAVTLDAKFAGDEVYVIGGTKAELGGSEYFAMQDKIGNSVPEVNVENAIKIYNAVSDITERKLASSLHTPALGGLALGFVKVSMGGRLGLDIDVEKIPVEGELSFEEIMFSESNSRFIMTANPDNAEEIASLLEGISYAKVGYVREKMEICFEYAEKVFKVKTNLALEKYKQTLHNV
jgi:phosphoribosylformylglycinamidine synthase